MSPSPGTSRCDDATRADREVAHLHEPDAVDAVADRRREAALGPARVELHAHADVEPAGEVDRVAQRVHEARRRRAASSCARSRTAMPRAARLGEHGRERGLERVGGLLPGQRRERAGREHEALGADRGRGLERAHEAVLLLRPSCAGSARWNGPSPMRFATRSPRRPRRRRAASRRPSRTARASRPRRRRWSMPCAVPEREVLVERRGRRCEIALTHDAGCIARSAQPSVSAAGDAAAAVELQVDAGDELRLSRLARYTAA